MTSSGMLCLQNRGKEQNRWRAKRTSVPLAEYVERIFAEHFEGGNDMQTERTLAVKISAELFDRLKEYLEKNHLKQKDFITQLLQQALDNAEE